VIEIADSPGSPKLSAGDAITVNHIRGAEPGFDYTYNDRQRRPVLLWLTVLFAVVVIALGRFRGLAAIVGLGASIVVILQFVLPSMLDGNAPSLVAIVGASAVAYLALYLANGFRPMTTVALLGTLCALALTVGLATLFSDLAHFSGAQSEDALLLKLGASAIDLKGLVLAGMVLGALGALNDITVTQSSAVGELRTANPTMDRRTLYRSGLRIGRDHISSTVNTLALAYAGASLPLLILFGLSGQSLGTVANGEVVAVEIVSTLVGGIGLVTAVPISTWLAVLVTGAPGKLPGVANADHDRDDHVHVDHANANANANADLAAASESPGPAVELGARTRALLESSRDRRRRKKPLRADVAPRVEDLLRPRDEDDFWR